jgi:hypothetical protein
LAFQLLFDWYVNALQATTDSAGRERAIELLGPYNRNANVASYLIVYDVFGLDRKDLVTWDFIVVTILGFMTRGPVAEVDIYDKGGVCRVKDCPFRDGPVEHCILTCGKGPNISLGAFGIKGNAQLVSSLSQGDKECRWVTKTEGDSDPSNEGDLGLHVASTLPWKNPKELVDSFSVQYYAEWWVIATRALIDHLGEEKAAIVLGPYMKYSGVSYGLKASSFQPEESGQMRISRCIVGITESLQMKASPPSSSDNDGELTIIECPFKDAPIQVCRQFESFCNGICEAIDPSYEFAYDRMMTKGDKTCHWAVRKKGWPTQGKSKEEALSEDPAKALAMRFARGEITDEELEKKMAQLRRLGLMQ